MGSPISVGLNKWKAGKATNRQRHLLNKTYTPQTMTYKFPTVVPLQLSKTTIMAFCWPCSACLSLLKLTVNRTFSWDLMSSGTEPQVTLHQSAQSGKITNITDRNVQWLITYMITLYTWRQIYISAVHVLHTINGTSPLPLKRLKEIVL